jgi:hypothetical protein
VASGTSQRPTARTRWHAYATSALLLGAAAYPAFLPPGADGFPLSTYPMFARARPERVEVISALAVDADGKGRAVPPSYVANAEAMQALQTLRKSVRAGRKSARALCQRIAHKVATGGGELAAARRVEIVTDRIDSVRYLQGETAPLARKVHVRCDVPSAVLEVAPP